MDVFFIILLIIVVLNVVSSLAGKSKSPSTKPRGSQTNRPARSQNTNPWEQPKSTNTDQSFKSGWTQAAAKEARRQAQDMLGNRQGQRNDHDDKNRHRISGWGERAGPGILTLSNIFILFLVLGVLAYVFVQTQ